MGEADAVGLNASADLFDTRRVDLDLPDAQVEYMPGFLNPQESKTILDELKENAVWQQPQIKLFGKTVQSPRLSAWYGSEKSNYTYSGLHHKPLPWLRTLSDLRTRLQDTLHVEFNSVLLNLYRNGYDSMGWHSDNEKELGEKPAIASISLGAERMFLLKHKQRKDIQTTKILLANGSLLFMSADTQKYWKHSVPKTNEPVGARINLTFRRIV